MSVWRWIVSGSLFGIGLRIVCDELGWALWTSPGFWGLALIGFSYVVVLIPGKASS